MVVVVVVVVAVVVGSRNSRRHTSGRVSVAGVAGLRRGVAARRALRGALQRYALAAVWPPTPLGRRRQRVEREPLFWDNFSNLFLGELFKPRLGQLFKSILDNFSANAERLDRVGG